jgi:hypothetical protein
MTTSWLFFLRYRSEMAVKMKMDQDQRTRSILRISFN